MSHAPGKLVRLAAVGVIAWMMHTMVFAASAATIMGQGHVMEDPGDAASSEITQAIAVLHPTQAQEVQGTVAFAQTPEGLHVKAEVMHLPSGKHAYHVHLYGDCCEPDGKTAGTHFNFQGSSK